MKASEDSQSRAVTRRAQLSIQAELQLSIKHKLNGFEKVKAVLTLDSIFENVRKIMLDLSDTPKSGIYTVEFVYEKFGSIIKYTSIAL